jgi:ribose-phosphate pyrophosphokinase
MTDLSLSRSQMLLLSGSANRPLAEEVAAHLGQPLCQVTLRRFADGELFVKIDENVRGRDVYIIQPTNPPAENMMELLLLMDAARRASAARVTAVIPYFGYARQDRKDQPRVAISAKLMANMVSMAGADRVLAMDFHQHQLQGFFDLPVDHLYAAPVLVSHYRQKALRDLVIVAPDVGSAKMARGFAKRLNASLAIIDKRRPSANVAEVLNVVGEVGGKDCLIPDDMIDTAGTMAEAVTALKRLLRHPRPALGSGGGPADGVAGQGGGGDEHHRHPQGAAVRSAQGALDRRAPVQGDRLHPQRPVGELAVRLGVIPSGARDLLR